MLLLPIFHHNNLESAGRGAYDNQETEMARKTKRHVNKQTKTTTEQD